MGRIIHQLVQISDSGKQKHRVPGWRYWEREAKGSSEDAEFSVEHKSALKCQREAQAGWSEAVKKGLKARTKCGLGGIHIWELLMQSPFQPT